LKKLKADLASLIFDTSVFKDKEIGIQTLKVAIFPPPTTGVLFGKEFCELTEPVIDNAKKRFTHINCPVFTPEQVITKLESSRVNEYCLSPLITSETSPNHTSFYILAPILQTTIREHRNLQLFHRGSHPPPLRPILREYICRHRQKNKPGNRNKQPIRFFMFITFRI